MPAGRVELMMISVAAQRAGMHPQTLRSYEARGLISPHRSSGNTRLYSAEDVARLARVQRLRREGINLAGALRVLALEEQLHAARAELARLLSENAPAAGGTAHTQVDA